MCCVKLLFFFGYINKKTGEHFVKMNENDEKVVKDKRKILKRSGRNAIITIRMGACTLVYTATSLKRRFQYEKNQNSQFGSCGDYAVRYGIPFHLLRQKR